MAIYENADFRVKNQPKFWPFKINLKIIRKTYKCACRHDFWWNQTWRGQNLDFWKFLLIDLIQLRKFSMLAQIFAHWFFLIFHFLQVSLDVLHPHWKNRQAPKSGLAAMNQSLKKIWRSGVQYENGKNFFRHFWKNSSIFDIFWLMKSGKMAFLM